MSETRDAASRFLARSICPVPIRLATKTPLRKWKQWQAKPMGRDTLKRIFGPSYSQGLGIVTGDYNPLNLCGLDVDDPTLAAEARKEFEGRTVVVDTPSGGCHVWVKSQEPCRGGTLAPSVFDLRATGQLLIVPPSKGYVYRGEAFTGDALPPIMEVGNALKFSYSFLRKHGIRPVDIEKPGLEALEYPEPVPAGQRSNVLISEGGRLQRAGYQPHLIEAMLRGIYVHQMSHDPPMTDDEFTRMLGQITQWDREYQSGDYTRLGVHTQPPRPPRWLVHEFLYERYVSILYGYGGQGKSYASLWLLLCLLTGTPFIDMDTAKLDNVIWWDYETDRYGLELRAFPLAYGMGLKGLPDGFHHFRGRKSIVTSIPDMERLINATGAQAMILDSMTRGLMSDPKDVGPVVEAMDGLDRLPVPVILIDHQAGQQSTQSGGRESYKHKEPMGARQKVFIARNVWQAERVDAGSDKTSMGGILTRKKNNLNLPNGYSIAFRLEGLTTGSERLVPAGAGANLPQRVFSSLQEQARPMSARDLHEFWHEDAAYGAIQNALTQLVKDGTVTREGAGQGSDPYRYLVT